MQGESNLALLIRGMRPKLNEGEFVFTSVLDINTIDRQSTLFEFKEKEGITIVIERRKADELNLKYEFVASWITLMVHSALEAVGLTAAFSQALTKHNISCNVVAGYYHDHIFVEVKDAAKAITVLELLSQEYS
jgi:hypothetical protein